MKNITKDCYWKLKNFFPTIIGEVKYRKSRSNEFSGNLLEERVKSFSFENFAR